MFAHATTNRNFIYGIADSKERHCKLQETNKNMISGNWIIHAEKNLTKLDPYLMPYQKKLKQYRNLTVKGQIFKSLKENRIIHSDFTLQKTQKAIISLIRHKISNSKIINSATVNIFIQT